ncbi:MAG: dolichyl-phosphate beta-glucosyltransferase, partial [Planctomycetota bacterium]
MNSPQPFLSIIVPVYNESNRIQNLYVIDNYLRQQKFSSELIIVDDGSTDNTLAKINSAALESNINIISYNYNRGKGYAIKVGMLAAKGNFCLFTDIDLSTPIDEFNKFLPYINEHDVVIASRRAEGAQLLERQPKVREMLGKGFTCLSQIVLRLNVSDFTCGFKCFSSRSARLIFERLTIDRWGFDSEILYIAHKQRFSIKEIPIIWQNNPHTKVKFPKDLVRSFVDLLEIRLNDLRRT